MPETEQTFTGTPAAEVPDILLNGPAAQAKSRTWPAVAVVTVRPLEPGVSVDVPVAGTSRPLGWSRTPLKSAAGEWNDSPLSVYGSRCRSAPSRTARTGRAVAEEAKGAVVAEAVGAAGHGDAEVEADGGAPPLGERGRQVDPQRRAAHRQGAGRAAGDIADLDRHRVAGAVVVVPQPQVHLAERGGGGVGEGHALPAGPDGAAGVAAEVHAVGGRGRGAGGVPGGRGGAVGGVEGAAAPGRGRHAPAEGVGAGGAGAVEPGVGAAAVRALSRAAGDDGGRGGRPR